MTPQPFPPFQVILLLGEASSRQRSCGLGQEAHKIVAEVEGDSTLVGSQPPGEEGAGGEASRPGAGMTPRHVPSSPAPLCRLTLPWCP